MRDDRPNAGASETKRHEGPAEADIQAGLVAKPGRPHSLTIFSLSMLVLMACGISCQTRSERTAFWERSSVELVWPPPPDPPRIEYVGVIQSGAGPGRNTGLRSRLAGLILGPRNTALIKPMAVAKNEAGLLVVADPGVPTVHFFDVEGLKYWRPKRKYAETFRSPVGVAVTREGIVYVADSVLGHLLVLNKKGRIIGQIGADALARPTGVALNAEEDKIYVVDTLACRVLTFDREGNQIGIFGERGDQPGQFNFPTFIDVTAGDLLFISDSLNFRIQVFQPDGTFMTTFGRVGNGAGDFTRPKGIAVDSSGRIYVVDAAFENVQVFDPEGRLLMAFGAAGSGPGEFTLPNGVFVDATNTIWVADSFNQRVLVFHLREEAL